MAETEGASLAASHGIGFCEVSVAENTTSLYKAFERLLNDSRGRPVKQRKFSVCKMIGEWNWTELNLLFCIRTHFSFNSSNSPKPKCTGSHVQYNRLSRAENQNAQKTHKTNDSGLWCWWFRFVCCFVCSFLFLIRHFANRQFFGFYACQHFRSVFLFAIFHVFDFSRKEWATVHLILLWATQLQQQILIIRV